MKKILLLAAALLLAGGVLAGCGTDDGNGGNDGGSGGVGGNGGSGGSGGGEACAADGSGTLEVVITGLPQGLDADVEVEPEGGQPISLGASETLQQHPAGLSRVTAGPVTQEQAPIVRPLYGVAGIDPEEVCVTDGESSSVDIVYEKVPTSERLWAATTNAPAHVVGYDASQLAASGATAPAVDLDATTAGGTGSPASIAFDREGNLWAAYASGEVHRYAAASMATSGDPVPDVVLTGFGAGLPGPTALAFDPDGNLWVAIQVEDRVVRFTPDQITASGAPVPEVSLGGAASGIDGPRGLAFDRDGNLWVATADDVIARWDASRLGTSSTDAPDALLEPMRADGGGGLGAPSTIAFDGEGNLWGSYFGPNVIARIDAADLTAGGARQVTPSVQITVAVTALLDGIAFDESGGLWVALGGEGLGRFAPESLESSGDKSLDTVIAGEGVPSITDVALFPAPRFLPLFHAVP